MLRRTVLLMAGLILLLAPSRVRASGWNGNGWYGTWMTRTCVGDDLVYYLNIGFGNSYQSFPILTLQGQCKCKTSGSAIQGSRPEAQNVCQFSTGITTPTEPNAGNATPVTATGWKEYRQNALHASPTGSTAFVPTLPYRPFPLPKYFAGSSPPSGPAAHCDTSVKPTVFQVFHLDGVVRRASMCDDTSYTSINVTSNPLQVQVTPDGKWGIVTSYDNAISFINTDTNTVDNVIQTDPNTFPSGLAISPDGSFALVTNYNNVNTDLLVIDLQKQAITRTIPLPFEFPQSVFLSPDATLAWVTYPFNNAVEVIDVMTGAVVSSLQVPEPIDVVFNFTGTIAYISSRTPGSLFVIDTKTYSVIQNIPTAAGSSDLQLSPDGGVLTVSNFDAGSISAIDTAKLTVIATTPLSGPPAGTALAPVQ